MNSGMCVCSVTDKLNTFLNHWEDIEAQEPTTIMHVQPTSAEFVSRIDTRD